LTIVFSSFWLKWDFFGVLLAAQNNLRSRFGKAENLRDFRQYPQNKTDRMRASIGAARRVLVWASSQVPLLKRVEFAPFLFLPRSKERYEK